MPARQVEPQIPESVAAGDGVGERDARGGGDGGDVGHPQTAAVNGDRPGKVPLFPPSVSVSGPVFVSPAEETSRS